MVDPHSDVVEAVFDRLVITPQEKAIPLHILTQQIDFFVAPDAGASKKIYKTAARAGKPVLIANKVRDSRTGEIKGLKFDSEDLSAIKPTDKLLVVDDICDGGRTFIEVAKALPVAKEQLSLYTTHGIYSKGFKTLNSRVGLIYGDSITITRTEKILSRLARKGFASDNVVFGIGSFTFQHNTRDTFGWAMKATYVEIDGVGMEIFKEPKTDNGVKKSARGLLRVDAVDGVLQLTDQVTKEEAAGGELRTVFLDGKITVDEDYATIRRRLGYIA